MAANWGDAFLTAVRTVLTGVASLPTQRAWMNTTLDASPTSPGIADEVVAFDSVPAECGPGANKRRTISYRVWLSWPIGLDGFETLAMAAAIEDAFQAATEASTMTISGGDPVELVSVRAGPMLQDEKRLLYPVTLALQFDHP